MTRHAMAAVMPSVRIGRKTRNRSFPMSVVKNNSVAKTRPTKSIAQPLEALENRQMMSASVPHLPAVLAADFEQPAVHAHNGHAGKGHANTGHATRGHGGIAALTPVNTQAFSVLPIVDSVTTTVLAEPKANWGAQWKNFSGNPLFAAGGPSPNDVYQGGLGDCWFLATLAEVAQRDPYRISSSIFERADGTYDVYFHTSPTTMVDEHVDGNLPVNPSGNLQFAKLGQGGCTWVAIMEKALTYFRNPGSPSYSGIGGGWGSESMKDLGGSPSELLSQVHTGQDLYNDVVWGLMFNTSMDVGTGGNWGPLVGEHEYSVISARVYNGVEQIELRNPWGYNPNYTMNGNYDWSNDGYIWVSASSVLPQLNEFVTAAM